MPDPVLTFGFIIATLFGAGFHLLVGGGARRLALFLVTGWAGFASGHIIGILFAVDLFRIGSIRFFSAALCAAIFLFFAHLLTRTVPSQSR